MYKSLALLRFHVSVHWVPGHDRHENWCAPLSLDTKLVRHLNGCADQAASAAAKAQLSSRCEVFATDVKAASSAARDSLSRLVTGADLWYNLHPELSSHSARWTC